MRKTNRRGLMPAWLLLLVALSALAFRPARAQNATPLEGALAGNLVTAEIAASSTALGELSLTLVPTGGDLVIAIPLGTRFVPDSASLSEVISVARLELLVNGPMTIDPLPVAVLNPDRSGPSPMSAAAYAVAGVADGALLELLERTQALLADNDPAAHLALWAVHLGRSVEEINAGLGVPNSPEDVARAVELAAGAQPPPTPVEENGGGGPATSQPQPTEQGTEGEPGGSLPIGAILGIGFVGLIALALGVAFVAQRRSATPAEDEWDAPPPPGRNRDRAKSGKPAAQPPPQQPASPGERPITVSTDAVTGSFVGADGPHSRQKLTIRGAAIISRSDDIEILALSSDSLSSPHVLLEWRGNAVEVKDLNSTNGTLLNDQQLAGRGKQEARFGDQLTLPGGLLARINLDGVDVNGRLIKKKADLMILSREMLEILPLGHADQGISDPHCLIRRNGDDYTVRDLNSSNGVMLDGAKLGPGEHDVPPGAMLTLGKSTFRRIDG